MKDRRTVAEGAHTAPVVHRIALDRDIDMPIVAAVVELLSGKVDIDELLGTLLSRPPGDEEDLEIDRDALLLPVAVARRVEPLFLSDRGPHLLDRLGPGDGWRRAKMRWRIEVLRAFHVPKMISGSRDAKR